MKNVVLGLMGILTALTLTLGAHSDKSESKPVSSAIIMMEHGDHGG
ncbi:hypothetical protein [Bacillus mycoides]|nr:hypothetical protein [Bacillus mycoides]